MGQIDEGSKMQELTASTATPKTAAEYRAAIDELLTDIRRMNERSERTWAAIEQLKVETKLIKERTDVLKAQTQARLAELITRLG
jgi:hypothetical protein